MVEPKFVELFGVLEQFICKMNEAHNTKKNTTFFIECVFIMLLKKGRSSSRKMSNHVSVFLQIVLIWLC